MIDVVCNMHIIVYEFRITILLRISDYYITIESFQKYQNVLFVGTI